MRALRLSLAGTVILALLGGGSIAVAQEPSAIDDLLPGVDLVTEEVEPGVHRVVSDGVRELSRPLELQMLHMRESPGQLYRYIASSGGGLGVSQDGVWQGRPEGIVRLGEEGPVWEPEQDDRWNRDFSVAPDGTLYRPGAAQVFDGETWSKLKPRIRGRKEQRISGVQFAPDGTLWVSGIFAKQHLGPRTRLAYRDADGWTLVPLPPQPAGRNKDKRPLSINQWGAAGDGTLYVTLGSSNLQRFDGTSWETLERPEGRIADLHVGADGTLWVRTRVPADDWFGDVEHLLRLGADGWTEYDLGRQDMYPRAEPAAEDGAFWYLPQGDPMVNGGCDGIARIDDTSTTRYLREQCVYDFAAGGPRGDVWLQAGTWEGNYWLPDAVGPIETYVIPSEARAAIE